MILKNVKIFCGDGFADGSVVLDGKRIARVCTSQELHAEDAQVLDGAGAYLIPGLIDLHFHGCMGDDFCDADVNALARMAAYEASVGVTAIAPATMTLPLEELEQVLRTAAQYKRTADESRCADLVGINMEGPFISSEKKGAQDARYILPCDVALCERFLELSEGLVKFIGIAPETTADALAFIAQVKDKVNVSLAHTNADYDTAYAAFSTGANHAVHLYNAMPAFSHRAPGVIGAVADSPHVMAELICDGIHVHPSVVRATFRMLGAERMIFISDSMRATGMPDGRYTLGGLEVEVVGKRATLVSDGAIAGSATNLMDCLRTAVRQMQVPLAQAVACATVNPARCLGIFDEYGSIEAGKRADLVLLNPDLEIQMVIKDGCPL